MHGLLSTFKACTLSAWLTLGAALVASATEGSGLVVAIGMHGDGRLAALLPETPLDGALVVAGRIEQTALQDVGLKTRIGAAVFPDDAETVEALVREG